MQIVIGTFIVKPEERDAFIESRREAMRRSRAEAGCITYAFTHDPIAVQETTVRGLPESRPGC